MKSDRKYLPLALILLVLWTPLIEGGTTYIGLTVSRLIVLGLVIISLWRLSGRETIIIPRHWTTAALLLLAVLLAANSARAAYGYAGMQWLINYSSMAVVLVAAARLEKEERRWVLGALLVCAGFEAIWGIIEYLGELEPRPNGTFFNPNYYGDYLAAIAVWLWGQAVFHPFRRKNAPARAKRAMPLHIPLWLEALILLVLIIGILVSQSRGAVIALFVGLVAVGMARWGLKVIPALVVMALLGLLIPNPFIERLESLENTDVYAWSRFDMWKSALAMIKDHPTGVGAGMYQYYSYLYAFPVEKAFGRYGQVAESAHSALLDIGTELGPLSLAIVLIIGFYLIYESLRKARSLRDAGMAGAMGALAVALTHSAVDSMQKSPPAGYTAAIFAGILLQGVLRDAKRISLPAPRLMKLLTVIFAIAVLWAVMTTFLGFEFKMLARSRNASRDGKGAALWLKRATMVNPGSADLWFRLAGLETARWRDNQGEEHFFRAREAYGRAIALNPMDSTYQLMLADLLLSSNEREKYRETALGLYKQAIARQPYNPFNHTRTGLLYRQMGRESDAEKEFRAAIELEPRYAGAYVLLADLLASGGHNAEAALYYRRALDIHAKALQGPVSAYVKAMVDINEAAVSEKLEKIWPGPVKFTSSPEPEGGGITPWPE